MSRGRPARTGLQGGAQHETHDLPFHPGPGGPGIGGGARGAAGILDKDVQTAGFSVYAQDQFDQTGQPTGARVFVVSNTVTFIARDIPKVGDVLSAALKAGANRVNGVSFNIEDPTAAMAEAGPKATADANA